MIKKRIYVAPENLSKLRKVFGISNVSLWKALTYNTNSALAEKIRFTALKQYGGVSTAWTPECETTHEEVERTMTQTWGDRVKLVTYKDTGDVVVYIDGRKDKEVKNISYHDFLELQQEVELKAMTL
ncbi:MAG: hypothetical protein ILA06_05980 [Bacteroidaceae bacterium]|nr:hypothetical protein [Bacteroidaceae bacterium]